MNDDNGFESQRASMVDYQLRARGIESPLVLEAMGRVSGAPGTGDRGWQGRRPLDIVIVSGAEGQVDGPAFSWLP